MQQLLINDLQVIYCSLARPAERIREDSDDFETCSDILKSFILVQILHLPGPLKGLSFSYSMHLKV